MRTDEARYLERTPWPHWAEGVFWGALALTSFAMLAGWDTDLPATMRVPIAAGIMTFGLALRWVIGGMTVRVDDNGVFLHLGRVPVLRRSVAFDEIEGMEVVSYRPMRDFGGWGIRGLGKTKAWTARGTRAVRLELTGERVLYIGSDVPQRLAERIRTIGGVAIRT